MTRKHFKAIAAIIKDTRRAIQKHELSGLATIGYLEQEIEKYLMTQNENFKRETFRAACS